MASWQGDYMNSDTQGEATQLTLDEVLYIEEHQEECDDSQVSEEEQG